MVFSTVFASCDVASGFQETLLGSVALFRGQPSAVTNYLSFFLCLQNLEEFVSGFQRCALNSRGTSVDLSWHTLVENSILVNLVGWYAGAVPHAVSQEAGKASS